MATARVSPDELAAWRTHPVTAWVLEALARQAEAQRDEWQAVSWEAGVADPALLVELRTRADAFQAVGATEYERFCEVLGEDPADK